MAAGRVGSHAGLWALTLAVTLSAVALPEPVTAHRDDWPMDCAQVTSSTAIFIGHDCGEWASIMIVGRIEIRKPWNRTTRASRAVRIRERREGRTGSASRPGPAATISPAPAGEAPGIPFVNVSGGNSPELDCEDFATQADAQAYFDANGWTAENDPFGLDQGGIRGVPCEDLP